MPPTIAHWRRGGVLPILQVITSATASGAGLSLASASGQAVGGVAELTPTVPDTGNATTNGTNLQTAITNAAIGDVIIVQSGATYARSGGFTFPAKGGRWDNRRVTVCCSQIAALPAGTRVTPSQAARFATMVTDTKTSTLSFAAARGWTLQGLEITYTAACQTGAAIPQIVDLTNAVDDLTLDRCWVHPRESVTDPSSVFRAADTGLAGIETVKNFRLTESCVEGFRGWAYNNVAHWGFALWSNAGSHLRIQNNLLQAYRGWYLQGAPEYSSDVVIQRNTFDAPPSWEALTNPSSAEPVMQPDHRHLILYAGENVLVVGNAFTGHTPTPLGIFFNQAAATSIFRNVRYLSNFLDGSDAGLSMMVLYHTPADGSDLLFVNNLVRGQQVVLGTDWAGEFGGPAGGITAGHGITLLHNTLRGITAHIFATTGVHPSAYCQLRYNIGGPGTYYLNTAAIGTDYPNLLLDHNRFIGGGSRPSYVSADQVFATDAAAGLGNAAAGDAGGAITNYALTSGTGQADVGSDHGCNIAELQAALGGTGLQWDYPERPRLYVDTTYALPGGTVRTVAAGDAADFQAKLNAAALGDVIVLAAGSTYTGNFTLPNKTTGSGWIYIISSDLASLPPPGTRVTPAAVAHMPTIRATSFNGVAPLTTANNAHHYRLVGCHITVVGYVLTLCVWDSDDGALAHMPHHIILDRCYLHQDPTNSSQRGVRLGGSDMAVIDSHLSDFKEVGGDTQAIAMWTGTGPCKIVNNYLEAASEIVLLGGANTSIDYLTPSDVEIRNNHFFKPLYWKTDDPSYTGLHYAVKNHLEIKHGQRVWIDGNTFENHWDDQQPMCITILVMPQSPGNPWTTIRDITFTNNRFINNTGGGLVVRGGEVLGYGCLQGQRILIQHNDMTCNEIEVQVFAPNDLPVEQLIIDHNVMLGPATHMIQSGYTGPAGTNFVFTNNIVARGTYGLNGNPPAGETVLSYYFPGCLFTRNVIVGNTSGDVYPAGNFTAATMADVGFVNLAGGDLHIASTSPYYLAGTDGKSLGADLP